MHNFKLVIEYDGTDYLGWQRQSSGYRLQATGNRNKTKKSRNNKVRQPSIQGTIEVGLYKIIGERINLIGSGRTDAGVHAECQVANFKIHKNIKLKQFKYSLNSVLPPDILVKEIEKVDEEFHARYAVKRKKYRYSIINVQFCSPFYRRFYTHIKYPLDFKLMKQEATVLCGEHDFKAFQSHTKKDISTIRKIYELKLTKKDNVMVIDIEANGFLYKMARNIVGTLIEIGRGKFPSGSISEILNSKDRKLAGPAAPSQGLCLIKINY